ncbi:rho GTPase-activating protein conundrum [Drosophila busckii]|uniref:rho GTPase-activating protein conundrum n=1 Tax=Drosophila busckii TaxID=30019 RepID=UPI00143339FD|nr:rho GTPase-activating protein conundrum [Drosophila busckii]XP_033150757.1 rho GTPase-activating protein conundrum [Drosophila busckii]
MNNMDNTCEQDYTEFLNEYLLQTNLTCNEPEARYEDGELEAEWLISAGYPELTKPFKQGLEVRNTDLEPVLAILSTPHADAIKQRVRALNYTVRGRTKNRSKRKPDIRDVFRDFDESSTGTRSRSATPDSLDSVHGDDIWGNTSIPSFVSIFDPTQASDNSTAYSVNNKHIGLKIRRTPSAPLKNSTSTDIFRGSQVRCDLPMYSSEGIKLLGFSRIGTLHMPRSRSGSDPSCSIGRVRDQIMQDSQSENNTSSGDSSDEYLINPTRNISSLPEKIQNKINLEPQKIIQGSPSIRNFVSFESMCLDKSSQDSEDIVNSLVKTHSSDINTINEIELKCLQPIFWLELATVFDRNHVSLDKRKPFKRRRKEEGNLFGVSLNALIRRDQQLTGTDSTLVPQFLEALLAELIQRGAKEEGILRVAGQKHKTEIIYNELETSFYTNPEKFSHLLNSASVHELSALLKRWLRELPQPLLSSELIQLYYQCHALPPKDQIMALSILCLMLPHENRNTLRSILRFLNSIIYFKDVNKMNLHNVSTIIAPSFFPPRFIHPIDKNNIADQVKMAALCCRLTTALITCGEDLFQIPDNLVVESRNVKATQGKRGHRHVSRTTSTTLNSVKKNNDGKLNIGEAQSNMRGSPRPSINPTHVHRFVV